MSVISDDSPDTQTTCTAGDLELLKDGNAAFGGKFLYEAMKTKSDENVIISPVSVLPPLAELALYAEGETLNQLLKTFNIPDKSKIRCAFPSLLSELKSEEKVTLNVANRIFVTNKYPLTQNFQTDCKEVFDAEAESVNFANSKATADRINEWVESKTNNLIKNLAKPDMFDAYTPLALANALYFLGTWDEPFATDDSANRNFTLMNKKTIQIPTMYQQSYFNYKEDSDLDAQVLEMQYKGRNYSFVIFLPNKVDGLFAMVEKLQDSSKLYKAYDRLQNQKVKVTIPKMDIESDFDLIPIMKSIGIPDILDSQKSNLRGILETYIPLYVATAVQKAVVKVDEKGTEATAATLIVTAPGSSFNPAPVPVFNADHPFAFYIMKKKIVLFSGVFQAK